MERDVSFEDVPAVLIPVYRHTKGRVLSPAVAEALERLATLPPGRALRATLPVMEYGALGSLTNSLRTACRTRFPGTKVHVHGDCLVIIPSCED